MQLIAQKLMKIKLLKNIGLFIWFSFLFVHRLLTERLPINQDAALITPQVAENEMGASTFYVPQVASEQLRALMRLKIPTRAAANSHQKQNQGFLACQRHRHPCTTLKASGEVV